MMSANSNVRRRGCATVQGTKTGALRSTCKGAGWTATVHPKHRLANVRHPHAAADSVEVRISQDCTVCESKCFTRHCRQAHGQRPSGLARRLLRPEVIESLGKRIRYFNTFGGNPVSCARVHAVLNAIKAGRLLVLISANGT